MDTSCIQNIASVQLNIYSLKDELVLYCMCLCLFLCDIIRDINMTRV